jgi:hypothetical protein
MVLLVRPSSAQRAVVPDCQNDVAILIDGGLTLQFQILEEGIDLLPVSEETINDGPLADCVKIFAVGLPVFTLADDCRRLAVMVGGGRLIISILPALPVLPVWAIPVDRINSRHGSKRPKT